MTPLSITALIISLVAPSVFSAPALDSSSLKKNGADAQQLNLEFSTLKKSDSCKNDDMACVEGSFAQCVSGKWETTECTGGTQCFALPLVNKVGTSISCDQQADAEARISSTGVSGGLTGSGSKSLAANPGATNSTTSDDRVNGTDTGANGSNANDTTSDCNGEETVTVTITDSAKASSIASRTFAASATASATLAPGFTLPPPSDANATATSIASNATASSSGAVSSAISTLSLNSTETSALPTGTINTTQTLSPASASAFLSSLSAANPGISITTLSGTSSASSAATTSQTLATTSLANAAVATPGSSSAGAISLSLFTTTPTGSPTGSPASLAAVPTSAGYGYRVRRHARGF